MFIEKKNSFSNMLLWTKKEEILNRMVFTVDHDQTLVGRQHPTTTTLTDNEKYEEPPSIMLRFIQKKPVSATTICVLINISTSFSLYIVSSSLRHDQ